MSIHYYDFLTEDWTATLDDENGYKIMKYHEFYKDKSSEILKSVNYDKNKPKETNILVNKKGQHVNVTKNTKYRSKDGTRLYFPHSKNNIHSYLDETGNMVSNKIDEPILIDDIENAAYNKKNVSAIFGSGPSPELNQYNSQSKNNKQEKLIDLSLKGFKERGIVDNFFFFIVFPLMAFGLFLKWFFLLPFLMMEDYGDKIWFWPATILYFIIMFGIFSFFSQYRY
tara:strand:- start:98 stop:775 length:678 start_codon:yes stop_codon:yes gene_type:complete